MTGPTGANGTNGTNGTKGDTGSTGPTGASGTIGTLGTNWADYLFWDNTTSKWTISDSRVRLVQNAGQYNQGQNAVAIGIQAGQSNQGQNAIAIGNTAGQSEQGNRSIAIGMQAGQQSQGIRAIGIGLQAGQTQQGEYAVAIGSSAGQNGQGINSIAIGFSSGQTSQGISAVAIGMYAGQNGQHSNTIILNASGAALNSLTGPACYIAPIREATASDNRLLMWNGNEIVRSTANTSASTKTFVIDHPQDPDRYLVHGCIEGPEVGIYYRGKGEILPGTTSVVINLEKYVSVFGYDFTVHITPIYSGQSIIPNYAASDVIDSHFTVYGEPGRFNWIVYGKRDEIEVEPLKSTVEVKGNGPYRWI
jgi:hypothetical protein